LQDCGSHNRRGKRLGSPRTAVKPEQVAAMRAKGDSWRVASQQLGIGVVRLRASIPADQRHASFLGLDFKNLLPSLLNAVVGRIEIPRKPGGRGPYKVRSNYPDTPENF
jgi:hypothetical protein